MRKVNFQVNSKIFDFLDQNKDVIAIYGGAGAGKSYAVAQNLAIRFISMKNKHFLITRKTNPALRISAYALMLQILDGLHIPYRHNKSEQTLYFGNNVILFKSLDDKEKIKSAEFNYIWMEEATEFDYEDYLQLRLRKRRVTGKGLNQLFMTFNPVMVPWLEKELEKITSLRVTYKDNAFLSKDYIEMLEDLKNKDEAYYKIYTLGEFAQIKGLIYNNWQEEDLVDDWSDSWFGLDFGYNNPTAMVEVMRDGEHLLVREVLYQSHMTNADLIEELKRIVKDRDKPIYCDTAEPNRIREIADAGFNAQRSSKEVKDGIDFVKRFKLKVSGPNLIEELKTYKWQENRNGKITDTPVKFNDHLMDAMRYAIYTHLGKNNKAITKQIDI